MEAVSRNGQKWTGQLLGWSFERKMAISPLGMDFQL